MDKLLLPTTDGNSLFFDWLAGHKHTTLVECTTDVFVELGGIVNNALPGEADFDLEKFKTGVDVEARASIEKQDLIDRVRDCVFRHVARHVGELGISSSQLVLVCVFKYFLEVANESKDFYKERTVTFKQASTVLDRAAKMLDVILQPETRVNFTLVKKDVNGFSKKQTKDEKDAVNMVLMKETSPQSLYGLFVKNIQQ